MQQVHVLCKLKNASLIETMRRYFCLLDWQNQKQTTNKTVCTGWRPTKRTESPNGTTHHLIFIGVLGNDRSLLLRPWSDVSLCSALKVHSEFSVIKSLKQ